MRFYTHNITPHAKTDSTLKIIFTFCFALAIGCFLFTAVSTSIANHSFLPALVMLVFAILIAGYIIITIVDIKKAYVEITGQSITVVDYYFLRRKERMVSVSEIQNATVMLGSSIRVRGHQYSVAWISYLVFRDENNKYLFKIINSPETRECFEKYIQIPENISKHDDTHQANREMKPLTLGIFAALSPVPGVMLTSFWGMILVFPIGMELLQYETIPVWIGIISLLPLLISPLLGIFGIIHGAKKSKEKHARLGIVLSVLCLIENIVLLYGIYYFLFVLEVSV